MKRFTCSNQSPPRWTLALIGAVALCSSIQTSADANQIVRELFDQLNAGHDYSSIDGLTNDITTVGLQGVWTVSPVGTITDTNSVTTTNSSTAIVYKDTWSLDWPLGALNDNLLSHSAGQNGLLNVNGGGNLDTLVDPETGAPFGTFTSKSYATHPLVPSSYVNFKANGTYYFSVRIEKSYPWWTGDSSAGFGLSTGNGTNDHFVGFGVLRPSCFLDDSVTDIGNADYVSAGTLGQAGFSTHPDDSSGPYYPNAYGTAGLWTVADGTHAGLLVGRLTTTTSGASTLEVKSYVRNGAPLDTDPNLITWDATYSFTETNVMTQLLVWMHGPNVEYDAIRVGTSYADVVGLELIGAPKMTPSSVVYAGTTVTVSENAALNTAGVPMSFQWLSNSVALLDATNASLVLTSPATNFTADYSLIVSNSYGMLTSAVTHLTVNPSVPPFFVANGKPVSISRYIGSPAAAFTAVVDGTPPFTFQWKHAGTNIFSPTTTSLVTNTLLLPPITAADVGDYSVVVTNSFGSTNSAVPGPAATLTEIVAPAKSYARAITTVSPKLYGYWRLDDNASVTNPVIHDFWGNHNGVGVDFGNLTFGAAGAPFVGFPNPHLATVVGNQSWAAPYRLDLSKIVYSNAMTFTMWVNGGCQFVNHNAYNAGWGLENSSGSLQFDWNGFDSVGPASITWNSGLSTPANAWTFVALVVEPTQATIYVGADQFPLSSATSGPLATGNGAFTNSDSTTIGDTAGLYAFGLGRNQWPWAEDGNGSQWASVSGTWSDVAIFYESLTPQQIQSLYDTTMGVLISATPDGAGNLILNWYSSFSLQEAVSLSGPWSDLTNTPPYSVPLDMGAVQHYYRAKR